MLSIPMLTRNIFVSLIDFSYHLLNLISISHIFLDNFQKNYHIAHLSK